ncbi:hypothetical protein, partial [Nocardia cyriacigeorgica]|uniref:hypothetical protein n=1 Tax=Nocardia cyriacigeorgica TaxID=135487 RepID=UPI0024562D64
MISGTLSVGAERLPRGHPNPIASSVATHIDGPCGTATGPAVDDAAGARVRDLCRLRLQRGRRGPGGGGGGGGGGFVSWGGGRPRARAGGRGPLGGASRLGGGGGWRRATFAQRHREC